MITLKTETNLEFIIFGVKGDLSNRKLFPALYQLEVLGLINPNTKIIGVGRIECNINEYIQMVFKILNKFLTKKMDLEVWKIFSTRLDFCNIDFNIPQDFIRLKEKLSYDKKSIVISYLSVPPMLFSNICQGLGLIGLNNNIKNRIVIEKPIGLDLQSFYTINKKILKYFKEEQIYRIDHYLGYQCIQNLLFLRFSNSLFLNNWNNKYIDHVQISIAEEIGVGQRGHYFDKIGQIRDMIQSHLLQILTIISMEPPETLDVDNICNEKIKILKNLRPITVINVKDVVVCGQYTSGYVKGNKVSAYLDEIGVSSNSITETFIAIRVDIDNQLWRGVPFYLRTGKRLPEKSSEIVIFFKNPMKYIFKTMCNTRLLKNKLIIRLQPSSEIELEIFNKTSELVLTEKNNNLLQINRLNLKLFSMVDDNINKKYILNAYEYLILNIMHGIKDICVRYDEIEESWKWIDGIIKSLENTGSYPLLYPAGTWGPVDSSILIKKKGYSWYK